MTPSAELSNAPTLDVDLYADAALRDSRDVFARIREAGPVVWLPRHRMYAMGRFSEVRAALRDADTYRSGRGVAANPITNRLARDTTLFSDGDIHKTRRGVLMRSLGAKAIANIEPTISRQADAIVEKRSDGEWFESTTDFSSHLPRSVVAELVGLPKSDERMLSWAAATFDTLGPMNRRGLLAGRTALGLFFHTRGLSAKKVRPGSWAASVFEARDNGELSNAEARSLCIDFAAPALDTTILATTHLLNVLAENPEAWQRIREQAELIPRAVVENVRLASPIRGFTRHVSVDHEVGGVTLPAGSRVVVLFGSANLDETEFPHPERFDLDRENAVQLGWGNGAHTCVGLHLAKLEMQALLQAMAPRVKRVLVGAPTRLENNTLQGISRLPAKFESAS